MGEGPGTYTVDREHARGGYRYLSLINNGTDEIVLTGLSVYFTAAPTQDLESSYTGYFHTNDELINRVWYAGAYTNRGYPLTFTIFEHLSVANSGALGTFGRENCTRSSTD